MAHLKYSIYSREKHHEFEKKFLAPFACRSQVVENTRKYSEIPHPYRTALQRDRDRIIHSRAFRRLKHKRQVFLTNEGDHFRTRLTHTMEVSQLSRTIARALGINEDLTEAIALGHDLGHTPFGHLGESVLDSILRGMHGDRKGFPKENLGGFKHNYQSLRVVDYLECRYEFWGLNLTAPVREGILKHTHLKRDFIQYPDIYFEGLHFDFDCPSTIEGQVVAIADEIAQRTHDLEDGIRANLVALEEVKTLDIVALVEKELKLESLLGKDRYLYRNRLINGLINLLVSDVIVHSLKEIAHFGAARNRLQEFDRPLVNFSPEVNPLQKRLNRFIYDRIIFAEEVRKADEQAREVILHLYQAYIKRPELLPEHVRQLLKDAKNDAYVSRLVCDHIAGMTDPFAVSELRHFQNKGLAEIGFDIDILQLDWMR